jgi:hypothetical protein
VLACIYYFGAVFLFRIVEDSMNEEKIILITEDVIEECLAECLAE